MAYHCFGKPGALLRCLARAIQVWSRNEIRTFPGCCTKARKFSSNTLIEMKSWRVHRIGIKPFFKVELYPLHSLLGNRVRFLSTREFAKSARENRASFGLSQKHNTIAMYVISIVILVCGGSYAAVPLYRLYCQVNYNFVVKSMTLACGRCHSFFKEIFHVWTNPRKGLCCFKNQRQSLRIGSIC